MHSHSIKVLLDLPELNVIQLHQKANQVFLDVTPVDYTQPCPICTSNQTIRHGTAYQRKVRHLDAFGRCVCLILPAIRLTCTNCLSNFNWIYDCVAPKKRYTKAFEASLPKKAMGATIVNTARTTETPVTTVHRVVNQGWQKKRFTFKTVVSHKHSQVKGLFWVLAILPFVRGIVTISDYMIYVVAPF